MKGEGMKENDVKGMAATAKAVEEFYRSHCANVYSHMFDTKDKVSGLLDSIKERDESISILNARIQELERKNTDLMEENSKMLEALNSSASVGTIKEEVTN